MRGLLQSRPRPIRGWLRTTLTIVWVVILSMWMFYHSAAIYLVAMDHSFDVGAAANALTAASALLRTLQPLWLAFFLPALATGLAWYLFSFRHAIEKQPGVKRRTLAELYGTLCIAMFGSLLSHRLISIVPLLTSGGDRISDVLASTFSDPWSTWSSTPWIEQMAICGALLLLIVLVRAWSLLPRIGETRRAFFTLAGVLLTVGLVVSDRNILVRLVEADSWDLHNVGKIDAERGAILGEPRYASDGLGFLSTYLITHDDQGRSIYVDLIRKNQIEHIPWDAPRDPELRGRQNCELCRIPGVAAWTMSGLSFYLSSSEPIDQRPTHVVEVPRRGSSARVYQPLDTSTFDSMGLWESAAAVAPSDWVVLKIDGLIKMDRVRDLLRILAEGGVRRIDLAVVPHGFEKYPGPIARMVFRTTERAFEYVPLESLDIRKYVPPPPPVEQPGCQSFNDWDYRLIRRRYVPTGDIHHPELKIETTSETSYVDFVAVLSAALFSQPDTVVITIAD